jgi:hypothetical protein
MRRYAVLQERVKQGDVKVEFIRDANNAADFLTKWVPAAKLKASIAYTSNEAAKPKNQGSKVKDEISTLEVSMIEAPFMTMRSNKRKYAPEPPPAGQQSGAAMLVTDYGLDELFAGDAAPVAPQTDPSAHAAPAPSSQPAVPSGRAPPGPSGSDGRLRHDMRRYSVLYGRSPGYEGGNAVPAAQQAEPQAPTAAPAPTPQPAGPSSDVPSQRAQLARAYLEHREYLERRSAREAYVEALLDPELDDGEQGVEWYFGPRSPGYQSD